jgi:hypothetical protein
MAVAGLGGAAVWPGCTTDLAQVLSRGGCGTTPTPESRMSTLGLEWFGIRRADKDSARFASAITMVNSD